jgi:hypothetical protein
MPAAQQEQPPHADNQGRQRLSAAIGKHVLRTLGQPADLREVQVRPLWEDHYRVNVLVGVDAASARVAHSYFVQADGDGNVLAATPKITNLYHLVAGGWQPLFRPRG